MVASDCLPMPHLAHLYRRHREGRRKKPGLRVRSYVRSAIGKAWYTDRDLVSRWDRILVFIFCNIGAAVCFVICFVLFPVLTLKPRKFAIL